MLKFLLYCNLATMPCTADDINKELSAFAESYVQVNDSLWFFKYPDGFNGSPLPKEEYLFNHHFEKFTNGESIIFIELLHDKHYYQLPNEAYRFLDEC